MAAVCEVHTERQSAFERTDPLDEATQYSSPDPEREQIESYYTDRSEVARAASVRPGAAAKGILDDEPINQANSTAQPDSIPVEEDPRVLELKKQHEELERKADQAGNLGRGIEKNIEAQTRDAEAAEAWGSFRWDGPQIRERIAEDKKLLEAQRTRERELKEQLENSKQLSQEAMDLERKARELEAGGDSTAAKKLYEQAQSKFDAANQAVGNKSSINTNATRQNIAANQKITGDQLKTLENMERLENGLRVARDTLVIAGATIATGGAAAAVGGVAGAAAGIAAGTAYGSAVGAGSAYSEAARHVAVGNKTKEQAYADAGAQTAQYAKDSLIASVSTVAAGGVAARIIPGGGAAASVGQRVVAGSAGGATASAGSNIMNTGINIANGTDDRNWGQRAADLGIDIVTGAASGAIGARGGVAKQGLGRAGKTAVTGAQVAAESAIGVAGEAGKAAVDGREFTFDNAVQAAGQSVWAGVVGEIVSGSAEGAAPAGRPANRGKNPSNNGSDTHPESARSRTEIETGPQSRQSPNIQEIDAPFGRVSVPDGRLPEGAQVLDPGKIRYSQQTMLEPGYNELVDAMTQQGFVVRDPVKDVLRVVKMPDGKYTSLDNRRVAAARHTHNPVVAKVYGYDDPLPPELQRTFRNRNGGPLPKTWGEAVDNRINQTRKTKTDGTVVRPGNDPQWSRENPYGTEQKPQPVRNSLSNNS